MATTAVSYFKRYKMEADLHELPPPSLPPGFRWLPWGDEQLAGHAEVLYESFHQEIDAVVFPSLGSPDGCVTLMTVVSRRLNFLAEATWLAVGPAGPCGAIQGLHERGGVGRDPERRRRSGRGAAAASARRWCCRRCTASAGPAWPAACSKSPPRTRSPSASIAVSASAAPGRSTRPCPKR